MLAITENNKDFFTKSPPQNPPPLFLPRDDAVAGGAADARPPCSGRPCSDPHPADLRRRAISSIARFELPYRSEHAGIGAAVHGTRRGVPCSPATLRWQNSGSAATYGQPAPRRTRRVQLRVPSRSGASPSSCTLPRQSQTSQWAWAAETGLLAGLGRFLCGWLGPATASALLFFSY